MDLRSVSPLQAHTALHRAGARWWRDGGGMTQVRNGPAAPRASDRRFLAVGVLAGLAVNATAAWTAWQALQGDRHTLLQSEFQSWLTVIAIVASATVVSAIALRAKRGVAVGLMVGLALAGVADLIGLFIEMVTSTS